MRYHKDMLKRLILKKIQAYVRKYFAKHPEVKLVVVVGSVGKTSTKRALADVLSRKFRVRMHEGNHNTEYAAPLAILGIEYPTNIRSKAQWLRVFAAARARIRQAADVDVIIQELGTDHPGDIAAFGTYLVPDIALVTAVTPEHMEFFGSIEAVAQEELSVSAYAKFMLINRDDVEGRFADFEVSPNFATYGTTGAAEYRFEQQDNTPEDGYRGSIITPNTEAFSATIKVVGEHSLRPVMGAVAAATLLGLTPADIVAGIALIRPVPGRMNMLRGMGGTSIIDDTYNSSPAAASAALQTLYSYTDAPQRIAVLGDMRELGATSPSEHEKLGSLCDGSLLDWLVLVGPDTEKYTAPAAKARGCQVYVAKNALEAGEFVRSVAREGAVILVKGSQNTIYLEEAVKVLCDLGEHDKLVRQSDAWRRVKDSFFQKF